MTERDRLIELLKIVDNMRSVRRSIEECADYLLANGVIVPPCNEGDTVYVPYKGLIVKGIVIEYSIHSTRPNTVLVYIHSEIGTYKEYRMDEIFYSKKEVEAAEQALKGG